MDFTFGILTYNSDRYILETLESIKFQLKTYGKNINASLIIADDNSTDKTLNYVTTWLSHYNSIFYRTKIIKQLFNCGTVRNSESLIENIANKYFHIIAGDDLYSNQNIFEIANLIDEYDIISNFPLCIDNNRELFIDYNRLLRFTRNSSRKSYTNEELVKLQMYGSFLHSPSTLFRKELLNPEIINYVRKFFLFDDDPKWYKFLSNTNKIYFGLTPIVLYRYGDNSVSHTGNKLMIKDRSLLLDDYINVNKNFLFGVYLRSLRKSSCRKFTISNLVRFCETRYLKYFGNRKEYTINKMKIEKLLIENMEYYKSICDNVNDFILHKLDNINASN